MRYFLAIFALCGTQAIAQNTVADWFPLHTGDKWTYEHDTRDDTGRGPGNLETHRWITEETIAGSWAIPEGVLAERRIRVSEGSPPPGYRVPPDQAYLIRDDCAYTNYVSSEPSSHRLAADFRVQLLAGHISPDFCFPLTEGRTWGAPHWGDWRPAADAKDWQVKGGPAGQNTFHIVSTSSYPGSGMTVDIWFQKGVGIVREEEIHHGTIGETRIRLIHFDPATPR